MSATLIMQGARLFAATFVGVMCVRAGHLAWCFLFSSLPRPENRPLVIIGIAEVHSQLRKGTR